VRAAALLLAGRGGEEVLRYGTLLLKVVVDAVVVPISFSA
jgi:hypothetical protein